MKIRLSKAHEYVVPSRSAIFVDARTGKLSTEKGPTRGNKKVVDLAELQRVYGQVRNPKDGPNDSKLDGLDALKQLKNSSKPTKTKSKTYTDNSHTRTNGRIAFIPRKRYSWRCCRWNKRRTEYSSCLQRGITGSLGLSGYGHPHSFISHSPHQTYVRTYGGTYISQ